MISQEGEQVGSATVEGGRWRRSRKVLLVMRNAVLMAVGLTLTFPVSAVLVYHLPYWRLPVENRDGSSAEAAVILHAGN